MAHSGVVPFNESDPVEKLQSESKRAYAAFHDYLVMGAHRSLRKLLERYQGEDHPPTKSWGTISTWSVIFQWVKRSDLFDEMNRKRAEEAIEAKWREYLMGKTEVLGRLSEQARVNIADFVTVKLVPTSLIIPLKNDDDEEDELPATIEQGGFVQVVELNWDAIREKGHLIKSVTNTKYGPRIELHDGQSALIHVGRTHRLFTDTVNSFVEHKNSPEDNERSQEFSRSVSALAQAIREILPGESTEQDGPVGTSK